MDVLKAVQVTSVTFLFGMVFTTTLVAGCNILWTDILQHNPNRHVFHALILIPLSGILMGLFVTLFYYFSAMVGLAILVSFLMVRFRRIKISMFAAALPTCFALIHLQQLTTPEISWYTDHPDNLNIQDPILFSAFLTAYMMPSWLLCWLRLNKFTKRN